MRVHVMDLSDGDVLLTDTFNNYGLLILSAGTVLEQSSVYKLIHHNIDYIDILSSDKGVSVFDNPAPTVKAPERVEKAFQEAFHSAKTMFSQALENGSINENEVNAGFVPLTESLHREHDLASLLLTLNQGGGYTYTHSVQVGMLSYYLSMWSGRSEEDSVLAGKAGYLHDIGMSRVPEELLTKAGKLTEEEYKEIQNHTLYGFEILKESFSSPALSLPALQHHERFDGGGYPYGKSDKNIHPVTKIVMIADIYSAMITPTPYRKERDLLSVLKELHSMSFGQLDPKLTHAFIKNMLPNLIGKKAVMNTGAIGTILLTNPADFFRPLVQIEQDFVDLSVNKSYSIEKIVAG